MPQNQRNPLAGLPSTTSTTSSSYNNNKKKKKKHTHVPPPPPSFASSSIMKTSTRTRDAPLLAAEFAIKCSDPRTLHQLLVSGTVADVDELFSPSMTSHTLYHTHEHSYGKLTSNSSNNNNNNKNKSGSSNSNNNFLLSAEFFHESPSRGRNQHDDEKKAAPPPTALLFLIRTTLLHLAVLYLENITETVLMKEEMYRYQKQDGEKKESGRLIFQNNTENDDEEEDDNASPAPSDHDLRQRQHAARSVVESLILAGADVWKQDSFGLTPLHLSLRCAPEITSALLLLCSPTASLADTATSRVFFHDVISFHYQSNNSNNNNNNNNSQHLHSLSDNRRIQILSTLCDLFGTENMLSPDGSGVDARAVLKVNMDKLPSETTTAVHLFLRDCVIDQEGGDSENKKKRKKSSKTISSSSSSSNTSFFSELNNKISCFFLSPSTRVLTLLLLALLHIFSHFGDYYLRSSSVPVSSNSFIFSVIELVASAWPTVSSSSNDLDDSPTGKLNEKLLISRSLCLSFGFLSFSCFFAFILQPFVLRDLLKFRLFGAESVMKKKHFLSSWKRRMKRGGAGDGSSEDYDYSNSDDDDDDENQNSSDDEDRFLEEEKQERERKLKEKQKRNIERLLKLTEQQQEKEEDKERGQNEKPLQHHDEQQQEDELEVSPIPTHHHQRDDDDDDDNNEQDQHQEEEEEEERQQEKQIPNNRKNKKTHFVLRIQDQERQEQKGNNNNNIANNFNKRRRLAEARRAASFAEQQHLVSSCYVPFSDVSDAPGGQQRFTRTSLPVCLSSPSSTSSSASFGNPNSSVLFSTSPSSSSISSSSKHAAEQLVQSTIASRNRFFLFLLGGWIGLIVGYFVNDRVCLDLILNDDDNNNTATSFYPLSLSNSTSHYEAQRNMFHVSLYSVVLLLLCSIDTMTQAISQGRFLPSSAATHRLFLSRKTQRISFLINQHRSWLSPLFHFFILGSLVVYHYFAVTTTDSSSSSFDNELVYEFPHIFILTLFSSLCVFFDVLVLIQECCSVSSGSGASALEISVPVNNDNDDNDENRNDNNFISLDDDNDEKEETDEDGGDDQTGKNKKTKRSSVISLNNNKNKKKILEVEYAFFFPIFSFRGNVNSWFLSIWTILLVIDCTFLTWHLEESINYLPSSDSDSDSSSVGMVVAFISSLLPLLFAFIAIIFFFARNSLISICCDCCFSSSSSPTCCDSGRVVGSGIRHQQQDEIFPSSSTSGVFILDSTISTPAAFNSFSKFSARRARGLQQLKRAFATEENQKHNNNKNDFYYPQQPQQQRDTTNLITNDAKRRNEKQQEEEDEDESVRKEVENVKKRQQQQNRSSSSSYYYYNDLSVPRGGRKMEKEEQQEGEEAEKYQKGGVNANSAAAAAAGGGGFVRSNPEKEEGEIVESRQEVQQQEQQQQQQQQQEHQQDSFQPPPPPPEEEQKEQNDQKQRQEQPETHNNSNNNRVTVIEPPPAAFEKRSRSHPRSNNNSVSGGRSSSSSYYYRRISSHSQEAQYIQDLDTTSTSDLNVWDFCLLNKSRQVKKALLRDPHLVYFVGGPGLRAIKKLAVEKKDDLHHRRVDPYAMQEELEEVVYAKPTTTTTGAGTGRNTSSSSTMLSSSSMISKRVYNDFDHVLDRVEHEVSPERKNRELYIYDVRLVASASATSLYLREGDMMQFGDRFAATLLHYAVWADSPGVVRELLLAGADPAAEMKSDGLTCLQLAQVMGRKKIGEVLEIWLNESVSEGAKKVLVHDLGD